MIKNSLSLLNNKPNIFSFPQSTIDSFQSDPEDKELFLSSIKMFMPRMKNHITYPYADFHVQTKFKHIDIIRMKQYPLPAVFNKTTRHSIINIAALQKRSISNIDMRDLYTILIYAHSALVLSFTKTGIPTKYAEPVCKYMGFVFLKLFAKRYGITGSYVDKIPQFRFIVYSYVYRSFFGMNQQQALKAGSILAKYDYSNMDVDPMKYDLLIFKRFLELLSESEVTPGMLEYKFLEQIIRSFGTMNLPFFEDMMRFSSIMLASTVGGNSYFSPAFQMFNPGYFSKVVEITVSTINKAM